MVYFYIHLQNMVGKYTSPIDPMGSIWPTHPTATTGCVSRSQAAKVTICTESTHANFVQKHSAAWRALGVDHRIGGPGKWTAGTNLRKLPNFIQKPFEPTFTIVFDVNFQECIYGYVWCCIVLLLCPNSFAALVWIGWFYHIPQTFYNPYTHSIHVWYISVRLP